MRAQRRRNPAVLHTKPILRLVAAGAAALIVGGLCATVAAAAAWSQQQELSASDGASSNFFGYSVALSGDASTTLVGALGANGFTGAAYVFTRSGSGWVQQQELSATDGAAGDSFGDSVPLSGDGSTALVGASGKNGYTGAVYVFTRSGSSWVQQQELSASDGASGDFFGDPVALSGDGSTALVGASSKNNSTGAAYVFSGPVAPPPQIPESPWAAGLVLAGAAVLVLHLRRPRVGRGGLGTTPR